MEGRDWRAEIGGQRLEDGGQRSEVRGPGRGQGSEVRVRGQMSEVRVRCQRVEVGVERDTNKLKCSLLEDE
jgi:hypothetical protein